jgi:hypothetical protein
MTLDARLAGRAAAGGVSEAKKTFFASLTPVTTVQA